MDSLRWQPRSCSSRMNSLSPNARDEGVSDERETLRICFKNPLGCQINTCCLCGCKRQNFVNFFLDIRGDLINLYSYSSYLSDKRVFRQKRKIVS